MNNFFNRFSSSAPESGSSAKQARAAAQENLQVCPICASQGAFLDFRGRPAEQCPTCKSLERTRHMFLFLMFAGLIDDVGTGKFRKHVVHLAPEESLFSALSEKGENHNYRCYDYDSSRYKFASGVIDTLDLADFDKVRSLPECDILIHNHVLEHVPCKLSDLVPLLTSAVKPGGVHAFSVPMRGKQTFDEDLSSNLSDEERKARFGQEDHVRIFGGLDVVEMMQDMLQQEDCVFRIHRMLTAQLAQTFGVKNCYDHSKAGKVNGSSIFFACP